MPTTTINRKQSSFAQHKCKMYKCGKFACLVIVLFMCLAVAKASIARGRYYNEDNPGKCTYKMLLLSPGESAKSPEECKQITCNTEDGWLTLESCILIEPPPHCSWGDLIDVYAPYPECCLRNFDCFETHSNNETLLVASIYQENVHNMLHTSVLQQVDLAASESVANAALKQ